MKAMKKQVEFILQNYAAMKKEVQVLEYELMRITPALSAEVIESKVFSNAGHERMASSKISDKTADIVVDHVDGQCGGRYHALISLLNIIRPELERLEYYMSLLPEDEAAVIKRYYIDGQSWAVIAENGIVVQRTLERRKKRGLERLAQYYSILYGHDPNDAAIWLRPRFISYIHDERFTYCIEKASSSLGEGIRAMLYIISGCNELWHCGVDAFFDFSTGEIKSDAVSDCNLTDNCGILLRLAYLLANNQDRDNLIAIIGCYFQDLEYVHLELAIEAVKMAIFSGRR